MLSAYARKEWLTILAIGLLLSFTLSVVGLWWLAILMVIATIAAIAFFRDPERRIPTQRGAIVAPADGRISSIHNLEHFEPLDGPAVCIRIFLSVFDVHINRSPCHGEVAAITHRDGQHLNALNPESAEVNESNLIVLIHPIRRYPLAAVRQVAGMLARTIVCKARVGQVLQRGERFGLIKLGSTTELYLPQRLEPQVTVQVGQKVKGGLTVVAMLAGREGVAGHPGTAPATSSPPLTPNPGEVEKAETPSDAPAAGEASADHEASDDSESQTLEEAREDASSSPAQDGDASSPAPPPSQPQQASV